MPVQGPRLLRRGRLVHARPLLTLKSAQRRIFQSRTQAELLLSGIRSARARIILSYSLLTLGSLLCSYVAGNYAWMYVQQEKLLRRWSQGEPAGAEALVKLLIPKIHLEAVVLEGTSKRTLLEGPARLVESALPGTGGNLVIAGHRDTFFRHIHSLRYGDEIYVFRSGQSFRYTVVARRVVEPNDLSVLRPSKQGQLTLITCFPTHAIGPAPQRLIVIARLADNKLLAKSPGNEPARLSRRN